jgi:hypothetical protein
MHIKFRNALTVCVPLAIAMSACGLFGPSNQEVIVKYRTQYEQMRADLKAIAQTLPDYGSNQSPSTLLNPLPSYSEDTGAAGNTDILMYEHLIDPDAELSEQTQFDLRLSNSLRTCLQWTGPKNPMADSVLRSRADKLDKELQTGLQTRYLGVARILQYQPPVASSAELFSGGAVSVAGYLVDLKSKQVVCVFGVTAKTAGKVQVTVRQGEDPKAAVEAWARSSMYTEARQKFIEAANQVCGGRFVIRQ